MSIDQIIQKVKTEMEEPDSYPFLPEIKETLEAMQDVPKDATEKRKQLARGLGRLVTESFEFSESELGGNLLEFCEAFVAIE